MKDIERKRGDTYPIELTINTDKDISGATFLLTVDPEMEPETSTNNVFQLTGTIVDAQNKIIEFPVDDTSADNVGSFFYDVEMIHDTLRYTLGVGKLIMTQDITK